MTIPSLTPHPLEGGAGLFILRCADPYDQSLIIDYNDSARAPSLQFNSHHTGISRRLTRHWDCAHDPIRLSDDIGPSQRTFVVLDHGLRNAAKPSLHDRWSTLYWS